MELYKLARELGKAIQADERYLNIQKCIQANDKDAALNELMAKIQFIQTAYQSEVQGEGNAEKLAGYDKEFQQLYAQIMQNENMKNYEAARGEIDKMMNYIVGILTLSVNGEDPETCEPTEHECGHDHDCDCGCHDCH
ncbi:MAG: YlbF family regulator [Oscillospiraceae bacterium]|nr:YlbF family regulator [Oscillospiraceae bacterium]